MIHLFVLGYFKTNFILKQKCSKTEINNWKLDVGFLLFVTANRKDLGCVDATSSEYLSCGVFLNASCVKHLRLGRTS